MQRADAVDYLDRDDTFDAGLSTPGIDYSLPTQVLAIQRNVLNQLMSEAVAQRILDSQAKVAKPDAGVPPRRALRRRCRRRSGAS